MIEVLIVGKSIRDTRCVYINDTRVVGGKPYVSEGLDKKTFECEVDDILSALDFEDIKAFYLKNIEDE